MVERLSRRTVFAVVSAVLGLCVLAPSASADPNKIYACVNNSSGGIKIVDENTVCNNEHKISWNKSGSTGARGPTGSPRPDRSSRCDRSSRPDRPEGLDRREGCDWR